MNHALYSHIKTLRGVHHAAKIQSAFDSKLPISHKYLNAFALTECPVEYQGMIKLFSGFYGVLVCYNQYALSDGLWVVGNSALVSLFCDTVESIINKVESITRQVKTNHYNKNLTVTEARDKQREKGIMLYLNRLEQVAKGGVIKIFMVEDGEYLKKMSEYISESSNLRSKNKMEWSTGY